MRMRWVLAAVTAAGLGAPGLARAAATASFTPSRTQGVAPLAVFFDAGGSSCQDCAGVVNAWHDLAYSWDFADPLAGTWPLTGRSRSRDSGPLAAHVFEQPGVYMVTLTVTDPVSGETASVTQEITVDDPDATFAGDLTRCYRASDDGEFAGCPAGALQQTMASFDAAIADCKGAPRRCLLRRGDTFTTAGLVQLGADAPKMIGAFGRGPAPVIDASTIGAFSLFSGAQGGADYRIVDLALKGPAIKDSRIYGAKRPQRDVLLLRLSSVGHSWHGLVVAEQTQLDTKGWHEGMFIVDSVVEKSGFGAGGTTAFFTFKNSALLGNDLLDSRSGEHVIRAGAFDGLLIAHNRLGPASGIRSVITMRSVDAAVPCQAGVCAPSRRAVILDNTLRITNGWTVHVCGQSEMQTQQCEDTIVDGNFAYVDDDFPLNKEGIVAVFNLADQTTRRTSFRNNICNMTNSVPSAIRNCADLQVSSLARALNNTCFRADDDPMRCVNTYGQMTPDGVSTIARNNLAYSSGAGTVDVVSGGWKTVENNLEPAQNPFAAAAPGAAPTDFMPAGGSPALDGGAVTANLFDFGGRRRPAGSSFDVGAWEFGAVDLPLAVDLLAPAEPLAPDSEFMLSATTIGGSGPPAFAWDCDGDAQYEQDTGAQAMVVCPGLPVGVYTVRVRVSDDSGSVTDEAMITVDDKCGDGVKDPGEECDGEDFGGETCGSQGYDEGSLVCLLDCRIDTGNCFDLDPGIEPTTAPEPTTGSPGGTTTGDTGGSSGSAGDTGGATGEDAGCGCHTPGGPGPVALLPLLLALRRRR